MTRPEYSIQYFDQLKRYSQFEESIAKCRKIIRDLHPDNIPYSDNPEYDVSDLPFEMGKEKVVRLQALRTQLQNGIGVLIERRNNEQRKLQILENSMGMGLAQYQRIKLPAQKDPDKSAQIVTRKVQTNSPVEDQKVVNFPDCEAHMNEHSAKHEEVVLEEGDSPTLIREEQKDETTGIGSLEEVSQEEVEQGVVAEGGTDHAGENPAVVYTTVTPEGEVSIDPETVIDIDRPSKGKSSNRVKNKKGKDRKEISSATESKSETEANKQIEDGSPEIRKILDAYLAELESRGIGIDDWVQSNQIGNLFLPRITETDIRNFIRVIKTKKGKDKRSFAISGREIPILRYVHDYSHLFKKVMEEKYVKRLRVLSNEEYIRRQEEKQNKNKT